MTWWVYAVTTRGADVAGRGVKGERLEAARAGRLLAVVGKISHPPRSSADDLRRYDAVVRRLWLRLPLLPVRFATSFESLDDAVRAVTAREATLRRHLSRVRGRAQMTVRVLSDSGHQGPRSRRAHPPSRSPIPDPQSPIPDPRSRPSGASYLRARAAAAAREREVAGFAPLRAAVTRFVRGEEVDRRDGVASVYHLVPRGSVHAYRRRLEAAAAAAGVRVVITGPHPPYAFT